MNLTKGHNNLTKLNEKTSCICGRLFRLVTHMALDRNCISPRNFILFLKKENRKEKKIAPIQRKRKRNKREMIHTKEFIHHPPKIYYHTLAHLDQGL